MSPALFLSAPTAAGIPFVRVDVDRPELAWAELEAMLQAAGVMTC